MYVYYTLECAKAQQETIFEQSYTILYMTLPFPPNGWRKQGRDLMYKWLSACVSVSSSKAHTKNVHHMRSYFRYGEISIFI